MSADTINAISNWALIVSLIVGVIATFGIVQSSNVRDRALRRELAAAAERTESLRNDNLKLQKEVLDLRRATRGREITEQQRDEVVAVLKGKNLPDITTYVVHDPEAQYYAITIVTGILQKLGMTGKMIFWKDETPMQTGVMFCGDGTLDSKHLMDALIAAKIVTVGTWSPDALGRDKNGNPRIIPYCPPSSIFVGLRPPLQNLGVTPNQLR